MDPKALYVQLARLIEATPDLRGNYGPEQLGWLGRASALVEASGNIVDSALFNQAMDKAINERITVRHESAIGTIQSILYRTLARAEMKAPADSQGTFISAGNALDALAAVAKVLSNAKQSVLIIDPYLDEKALIDFAPMCAEQVSVKLLADEKGHKPGLKPASERFKSQFGSDRPLEVRLAEARSLHDRVMIVDGVGVWILTQSLNALAARSPASIVRVEGDAASLKIDAYEIMWQAAKSI